ncbi:hypothetical protein A9D60_06015 [Leisingera sp. JC1]|nr:hypothetical protein A9D60_06015 [Leisingera sp. JC1]
MPGIAALRKAARQPGFSCRRMRRENIKEIAHFCNGSRRVLRYILVLSGNLAILRRQQII